MVTFLLPHSQNINNSYSFTKLKIFSLRLFTYSEVVWLVFSCLNVFFVIKMPLKWNNRRWEVFLFFNVLSEQGKVGGLVLGASPALNKRHLSVQVGSFRLVWCPAGPWRRRKLQLERGGHSHKWRVTQPHFTQHCARPSWGVPHTASQPPPCYVAVVTLCGPLAACLSLLLDSKLFKDKCGELFNL